MELEEFQLVMLRRPADATPYDDETLDRIQEEHLAYLESMAAAGHLIANGPVVDQPDESLRGIGFYNVGSVDEARRLAEGDPAVRAGRLEVQAMRWWCRPGRMRVPGRRFELDDD
jgi:uncharacterized protein YciI